MDELLVCVFKRLTSAAGILHFTSAALRYKLMYVMIGSFEKRDWGEKLPTSFPGQNIACSSFKILRHPHGYECNFSNCVEKPE